MCGVCKKKKEVFYEEKTYYRNFEGKKRLIPGKT